MYRKITLTLAIYLILTLTPITNFAFGEIGAVEYLCEFGIAFYRIGRYDDALSEFKKVLILDPNNKTAQKYINSIFQPESVHPSSQGKPTPKQIVKKPVERLSREEIINNTLNDLNKKIELAKKEVILVPVSAFAGEINVLIKKLVEKGILTEGEAKTVLADTKDSVKKQLEAGKLDSVPAWVQATKFSGDLRLRFENRDFAGYDDKRNRARLRFRYGFTTKVNDQITVGARLATGNNAQNNSNEQTLDNAFSKRDIWLDLAYLDYKLNKNLKLLGGKFANPFYRTSEIIWGAALNPEGGALQYTKTIKPAGYPANIDIFVNAGILPLDIDTDINPVIYGLQAGAATNVFDHKLKTAVTYYYFDGIKDSTRTALYVATTATGNTLTGTNYLYNYRLLDVNAEYPLLDIELLGQVLPLGIYGNYVKNVAEYVTKDSAWLGGFKLGAAKDLGTWDFSYDYRRIESDATIDFLNDASFHAGGTNAKGHRFSLNYIPLKNTTLTLNYFKTEHVHGIKTAGEELDRLQLECLVKF